MMDKPILYKFIGNPDDVQFIMAGSLKFARISQMNDPNELFPRFSIDDVQQSLNKLRRSGYSDDDIKFLRMQGALLQRIAPEFLRVRLPETKAEANKLIRSSFYDDMETLRRLLTETAETISRQVGILCMTYRFDCIPMWAYYANNASGLVVEFSELEEVFTGDNTGIFSKIIPVEYKKNLPTITFDPHTYRDMFFSKFEDWNHEREVRVILPLEACDRLGEEPCAIHIFNVPRLHIRRILCGWRIEPEAHERVVDYARSTNPQVEIWNTRISDGKVERHDQIFPSPSRSRSPT